MKRFLSILITFTALLAFVLPVSASQTFPSFDVIEVVRDQTVTIQTYNFPANDTFQVTMGAMGTKGIGGVAVGGANSGSGGSFKATYNIPSSLVGSQQISIRLESPTSGFFAYNWFFNNTAQVTSTPPSTTSTPPPSNTSTPAPSATPIPGYSGFPTFSISSVVTDVSVTILTKNLPPNDTFTVTMGKMGTQGIGGEGVGSTNSGSGGAQNFTYNIPASLKGLSQISIRMQSPTTGYFAYNWFFNNTASSTSTPAPSATPTPNPTPTTPPSGYTGFPTFTISAVVQDKSVSIQGSNFPANDTFNVLMGPIGTAGVGGTQVGSQSSGSGGALSATYAIPSSLVGSQQIAIRLQSPTSGYFAYNWFINATTP
jgi:hypothetical protein